MNDDIVIRLREHHCCDDVDCRQAEIAADEIERLRIQRDHWQEQYRLAKECLDFIYREKRWWQK